MTFEQLPTEILFTIARDCGVLKKSDIFNLVLTCRVLYQTLREVLFRDIAYGCIQEIEEDDLQGILELHGFSDLPKCKERLSPTTDRHKSVLFALQDGKVGRDDLRKVREIRLYSDIESLHDEDHSIIKFLDMLQPKRLESVTEVKLYILRGSGMPNISNQSVNYIERIFSLLASIPSPKIKFQLVTDAFQCLEFISQSNNLVLETLFIDATLSNRGEIERWQEEIKQFETLVHLAYKGFSPWAAPPEEMVEHGLCDDFPNLKIIRLICSPNFTHLPQSVHELHIDIGERDQIIHHCFPLITTLPNLKILYALNRQNALPRFHFNPMQTVRLPGTAFTGLKVIHAEMPRPDEKLMFFPPGVLETIANCNPGLEDIFLPFISAYDMSKLALSDCVNTLRSLEIQSSICRTISRETSFEMLDLIKLFDTCGLPNLEVLKWSCGGKPELAVSKELIRSLFPKEVQTTRRHNLKLLAVESRLPKPASINVLAGLLNWAELLEHRQALRKACVKHTSSDDGDSDLLSLVKPIHLTANGVDETAVEEDFEFPYENPASVMVVHEALTGREFEYLRKWRRAGGSLGMTEKGMVYDFRKAVWEELYFFDIKKMAAYLR